ncbi:hypothetical protein I302_104429 [Kwoniella bestiolae CBS 10118]|uniref:Bacteriophage T5 Orf172 DNA-binding domain-containing protein n=1 Tax=Kwoniella bestiolae CBS 10118 TaxID=1296100 RepID=A0A1B9GB88_9TREE|nr:hypothetical protein I302_03134 [Kwoniella bestiolae CBS 10118]OCF28278.1 hypothetical protein I302_03134 [Kwoniella bestiolae CBS 10118]
MSYAYDQRSTQTYQQAFPSSQPQAQQQYQYPSQPGPSTCNHNGYQPPQPHQPYYRPNPGYHQPSPPPPPTQHKSKGYRYLESLSTSVANLNVNDNPPNYRSTSNGEYTNTCSFYNDQQPRVRLHSDPISPNYNKCLPALPPPPPSNRYDPIPPSYNAGPSRHDAGPSDQNLTPPPVPPRPVSLPLPDTHNDLPEPVIVYPTSQGTSIIYDLEPSNISTPSKKKVSSPPKTFRPSVHPHSKPRLSDENRLRPPSPHTPPRPKSDSDLHTSSKKKGKGKVTSTPKKTLSRKSKDEDPDYHPIIDLTISSSEDEVESEENENVTPRSAARRKCTTSEQPSTTTMHTSTPTKQVSRTRLRESPSGVVQCSGFTRTGQPCKRLVKVSAPYLSARDTNVADGDERSEKVMGRYCKDHAGMICQVDGFYWRGYGSKAGVWIDFEEFIPSDLGQQTQTLLRMTMESKLTAKESPGYLYVYELRDLETPSVVYFKVGRTDNVPRRIGEWTNRCHSKKPTLRDIFPLPPSKTLTKGLHRSGTLTTSFLPGATTHLNAPSKAMKRWERLVHLELSERSSSGSKESGKAFEEVRKRCDDCGLSHREIFPLYKGQEQEQVYETVIMEVIGRWDRFIRRITDS